MDLRPISLVLHCDASPNDQEELANHAEFLGIMSRREMLATFFVHDDQHWRIKGHAKDAFYRWLAGWTCYVRKPSDLGFSDEGFILPELSIQEVSVETSHRANATHLFPSLAPGVQGRLAARRGSISERIRQAVSMIQERPGKWLIWCGLNTEGRQLASALGDDALIIEGPDKPEIKLERESHWREGDGRTGRVLITKQKIFGFGMNWQHCHQMMFLGIGDSWEQYYQGIRRCWRYGQKHTVHGFHCGVRCRECRCSECSCAEDERLKPTSREVIPRMVDWEALKSLDAKR